MFGCVCLLSIFLLSKMKSTFIRRLFLLVVLLFFLTFFSMYVSEISFRKSTNIYEGRKDIFSFPWMALSDFEIFAFSAYFDLRIIEKPLIRILMWRNHRKHHEADCVVELKDGTSISLAGKFICIDDLFDREKLLAPTYLECQMQSKLRSDPYAVALRIGSKTSSFLEVNKLQNSTEKQYFLTVCTQELYEFDAWLRLIVFIEHYRAIGADKIIFYNRSVTEDVEKVLQFYKNSGLVETVSMPALPHPLPMTQYHEQLHTWPGQLIQISDCLFRSMGKTKFWTDVDVDEFIGNPASIEPDFLHHLLADISPQTGGIHIQSAFWNGYWQNVSNISSFELPTLKSLEMFSPFQITSLFEVGVRSKMIVRPETIVKKSFIGCLNISQDLVLCLCHQIRQLYII